MRLTLMAVAASAIASMSLFSGHLYAQATASATLQGTVADQSGAVVPKAQVKVASIETGLTRETTSNDAGIYKFELLPAGTYEVRVSAKGFATAVFNKVDVSVSKTTTINATLSVSGGTEVVTVE